MGPDDGDPSKPVVSVEGVECGGSIGQGFSGPASEIVTVGENYLELTYPCSKHEGANVTVLLNLHGSIMNAEARFYVAYHFAAHELANSHNLIVVTPRARDDLWGYENQGVDKPHLMEVVEYVYKTFAKFNIISMWIVGHGWGAEYAKRFVCEQALKEKVRGVVALSGAATLAGEGGGLDGGAAGLDSGAGAFMPTANCADYLGQIHAVGDMDRDAGLPDQSKVASKHGCGAKSLPRDLGNNQTLVEWPGCDKGWVHENITMGGHSDFTAVEPHVVKHIVEKIKETERR